MTVKIRKTIALVSALIGVFASLVSAPASAADQYDRTDYTQCAQTFYDRNNHNWLAIRNTCNVTVHVTWTAANQFGDVSYSRDIAPGQTYSTALSANEARNFEIATCAQHYLPVDAATLQSWKRGRFQCKYSQFS